MLELLRDSLVIAAAGISASAMAMLVATQVETVVAWM